MKHKLLLFSVTLLFGFGLTGLKAQTMYVNKKTGTQTPFTTSSIRTLTFATGRMAVNKTDKSSVAYTLSGIRYLSFNDYTTEVPQIGSSQNNALEIYPNPSADQLQISYETVKAGNAQVEIIDLQGKILLQQALNCNAGANHVEIKVTKLPKGIYLCRVTNGTRMVTTKFLKQ
jgi:hypothetical protein